MTKNKPNSQLLFNSQTKMGKNQMSKQKILSYKITLDGMEEVTLI